MTSQKTIRLSNLIAKKLQPIFNTKAKHIIVTSGRAGTKSSAGAILADYNIIAKKTSVVVLRKRHNKLRKTVYKEILRGFKRLCIPKSSLKVKVSPMEITYLPLNSTIYFAGSDNIDDTKGIIDEDNAISLVILDELTEFFDSGQGEEELTHIESTFVRGNDSNFKMLYMYNPPKNPNAPINSWLAKMQKRDDCIHIHIDYRDVPQTWLGSELIKSAETLKSIDEKMYRWVWLGESIGIDELIYYMYSNANVYNSSKEKYRLMAIGIDYGQQNPTTFQAFGYNANKRRLEGVGEYYHSGRESGKQKSPSEYASDFIEFLKGLHNQYSTSNFYVFIDPSARGLQEEIKRKLLKINIAVSFKKSDNSVNVGIQRVQKLLNYKVLTLSPTQENVHREFGLYEWDTKSIERGKETPVKENDHTLDAIRYVVMGMWRMVKVFLPREEQE